MPLVTHHIHRTDTVALVKDDKGEFFPNAVFEKKFSEQEAWDLFNSTHAKGRTRILEDPRSSARPSYHSYSSRPQAANQTRRQLGRTSASFSGSPTYVGAVRQAQSASTDYKPAPMLIVRSSSERPRTHIDTRFNIERQGAGDAARASCRPSAGTQFASLPTSPLRSPTTSQPDMRSTPRVVVGDADWLPGYPSLNSDDAMPLPGGEQEGILSPLFDKMSLHSEDPAPRHQPVGSRSQPSPVSLVSSGYYPQHPRPRNASPFITPAMISIDPRSPPQGTRGSLQK